MRAELRNQFITINSLMDSSKGCEGEFDARAADEKNSCFWKSFKNKKFRVLWVYLLENMILLTLYLLFINLIACQFDDEPPTPCPTPRPPDCGNGMIEPLSAVCSLIH